MLEKLVIYLHAHDLEHPSWAVVDADGSVRQSELHDNALGFSQIAEDKEVIVIVPGEEILITSVMLPKMNRSRLTQALPFALEEKLIDDVDTLHFARGDYHADRALPVAIVAREKVEQWLALLKSWNIQVDFLVSSALAVPFEESSWQIMLSDIAIVRLQAAQGFVCDKNNLAELLSLALAEAAEVPKLIHILNYTDQSFKTTFESPIDCKEEFIPAAKFMADLARHAGKLPSINLLQGAYATKKSKFPRRDKLWKASFCFAVAWVLLLFLFPTVSYFILKQRTNKIDEQISQIYKRNFPQSTSIVAPKMRLQEKLQKLTSQTGQNHLFLLLGYVAKGIQSNTGVQLKRFDFQNNQLILELTANTSEDFSTFTNFLTGQGLKVKQQNANLTGSRINATLQIE